MLGIRFIKATPTTHVLQFCSGKLRRSGRGLSFLYYGPTASIVLVPMESMDLPFAFAETTADFQQITVQGQFTYRVQDPLLLSTLFDFSVDAGGKYRSDDPQKLKERLMHAAQVLTREACRRLELRQALTLSESAIKGLYSQFQEAPAVRGLGIEILNFAITALAPSPEMARALEAHTRETLSREADEAIYQRRNAAVDQERRIKQNELQTELAVQEKRREIDEAKWELLIEGERKRAEHVSQQSKNDKQLADARAYGLKAVLEPLRGTDWKTLMAASSGGISPQLMLATAFREMAENAGKIGEINLTPDLFSSLAKATK